MDKIEKDCSLLRDGSYVDLEWETVVTKKQKTTNTKSNAKSQNSPSGGSADRLSSSVQSSLSSTQCLSTPPEIKARERLSHSHQTIEDNDDLDLQVSDHVELLSTQETSEHKRGAINFTSAEFLEVADGSGKFFFLRYF